MKVRVYFNLHKKNFSVQKKTDKGWRLWHHADEVKLYNVVFKVSKAGRDRVLREKKRKNVHAFVEGDWLFHDWLHKKPLELVATNVVTYNPYKGNTFNLIRNNELYPIHEAPTLYGRVISNKPLMTITT